MQPSAASAPPEASVRLLPSLSIVQQPLEAHFRGKAQQSRVLFLDDSSIVHAWDENGVEKRESVTTDRPPGHRECKALRSLGSQDFLLCMYWYTGPGGGRVDGVVFDIKRRIFGEFFSAAISIALEGTLCFPDTAVGPMPSYNMVGWETKPATRTTDAEVHVSVAKEGWTTQEAAALRALPNTKKFCECAGAEDCAGFPAPPEETSTVVYRLTNDQLRPSEESKQLLAKIAAQWGHNRFLKAWNLQMRGY